VESAVSGGSDLLFVPRLSTSFESTANSTVLLGVSAAIGPNNSGMNASTRIYGADVYWKWKSPVAQRGAPFVSLQAEVLQRDYEAAERASADDPLETLPSETLRDAGFYSELLWGFRPGVVAGLRADFASGQAAAFDSALRADRTRLSPNVTWYPSEFSKFRIQYNHDDRKGLGRDHSLWFQFEFILGAHASHKF
jgi:hypothetical protein